MHLIIYVYYLIKFFFFVIFFVFFSYLYNMPQLDLFIFCSQFFTIFLVFFFYVIFLKYILPIFTFEHKIKKLIQLSFKRKIIVEYLNSTDTFYSLSKTVTVIYQVLKGLKNFMTNIQAPRIVVPSSIIRYNLLLSYYKEKHLFIIQKLTHNNFKNNA